MYAIMQSGGKQYKVSVNSKVTLDIQKESDLSKLKAGNVVKFNKILGCGDGGKFVSGNPFIEGEVHLKVLKVFKDKKVLVFKKNRRKRYRRLNGHRQTYISFSCDKINCKQNFEVKK